MTHEELINWCVVHNASVKFSDGWVWLRPENSIGYVVGQSLELAVNKSIKAEKDDAEVRI
jgi:hypothetical protein